MIFKITFEDGEYKASIDDGSSDKMVLGFGDSLESAEKWLESIIANFGGNYEIFYDLKGEEKQTLQTEQNICNGEKQESTVKKDWVGEEFVIAEEAKFVSGVREDGEIVYGKCLGCVLLKDPKNGGGLYAYLKNENDEIELVNGASLSIEEEVRFVKLKKVGFTEAMEITKNNKESRFFFSELDLDGKKITSKEYEFGLEKLIGVQFDEENKIVFLGTDYDDEDSCTINAYCFIEDK